MGDALDSWVDLAKECSPVRLDIIIAIIVALIFAINVVIMAIIVAFIIDIFAMNVALIIAIIAINVVIIAKICVPYVWQKY